MPTVHSILATVKCTDQSRKQVQEFFTGLGWRVVFDPDKVEREIFQKDMPNGSDLKQWQSITINEAQSPLFEKPIIICQSLS